MTQDFAPNQFLEQALNKQNAGFGQVMGVLHAEADRMRRNKMMRDQAASEFDMRKQLGEIEFGQRKELAEIQFGYEKELAGLRGGKQGETTGLKQIKDAADDIEKANNAVAKGIRDQFPALVASGKAISLPRVQVDALGIVSFEGGKTAEQVLTEKQVMLGEAERRVKKYQEMLQKPDELDPTTEAKVRKSLNELYDPKSPLTPETLLASLDSYFPPINERSDTQKAAITEMQNTFTTLFPVPGKAVMTGGAYGQKANIELDKVPFGEFMSTVDKQLGFWSGFVDDAEIYYGGNQQIKIDPNTDTKKTLQTLATQYSVYSGIPYTDLLSKYAINPNWDRRNFHGMFKELTGLTQEQPKTSAQNNNDALLRVTGYAGN